MRTLSLGLFLIVAVVLPAEAAAQSVGTIPPVVFDVRGFYTGLGQDPVTAADLGVDPLQLPARGLGGVAGLHTYLVRSGRFALGVGGEAILARGRAQDVDESGEPAGPLVRQQLKGLSGNVSINFGDRNGWSYLTGGMGPMVFKSYLGESAPVDAAPNKMTINMGGGARWFSTDHLAVTFDVRFYLIRPEAITGPYPGRQRTRLLILSGGIALK